MTQRIGKDRGIAAVVERRQRDRLVGTAFDRRDRQLGAPAGARPLRYVQDVVKPVPHDQLRGSREIGDDGLKPRLRGVEPLGLDVRQGLVEMDRSQLARVTEKPFGGLIKLIRRASERRSHGSGVAFFEHLRHRNNFFGCDREAPGDRFAREKRKDRRRRYDGVGFPCVQLAGDAARTGQKIEESELDAPAGNRTVEVAVGA